MAVIKQPTIAKKDGKPQPLDKSVYASSVRIDRQGSAWQKKSIWLREECLGKLKVVAHFENKTIHQLIDDALSTFLKDRLDNSMAMRKLVGKDAKEKGADKK